MNTNMLPVPLSFPLREKGVVTTWRELMHCSTPMARDLLPFAQAEKFNVLPLGVHNGVGDNVYLTVAAIAELDEEAQRAISFISNAKVLTMIVPAELIAQARFAAYATQFSSAEKTDSMPAILRAMVQAASAENTSDIHLDAAQGVVRVRFRIDGMLRERKHEIHTTETFRELCRHIQVLSRLDSTFQRKPIEGSFSLFFGKRQLRIRASLFLQHDGGRVVLRLLDCTPQIVNGEKKRGDFQALGMTPLQEQVMRGLLGMNAGAIILAGPTGSGKSTLLYESLAYLQHSERCVVTLEDPIERYIQGVSQTEIDREQGLDYRQYLKPLLRQDPDVIMVGEIRDAETAQMALEAGITGHLILTTIHARNVIDVLLRLVEFGLSRQLIALSVQHLIAQRLMPKNCPQCRQAQPISKKFAEYFCLNPEFEAIVSTGCDLCEYSGIDGRVGVFETLTVSEIVKEFLLQSDTGEYPQLIKELTKAGAIGVYTPRVRSVRQHLISGDVSPFFALQAIDIAPELFGISRK